MPDPNPGMRDGMIGMFELRMRDLAEQLTSGAIDLGAWQLEMRTELRNIYALQVLAATGAENRADVDPNDWLALGNRLQSQYGYLADFAQEIADGNLSAAQIAARAERYAQSSQTAYWGQINAGYDLPAQPGEGTVCHCGCEWRIVENGDGSVDAYWERTLDDSCDICKQREQDWNPYHAREAVAA